MLAESLFEITSRARAAPTRLTGERAAKLRQVRMRSATSASEGARCLISPEVMYWIEIAARPNEAARQLEKHRCFGVMAALRRLASWIYLRQAERAEDDYDEYVPAPSDQGRP
jgi:hypothetical protein